MPRLSGGRAIAVGAAALVGAGFMAWVTYVLVPIVYGDAFIDARGAAALAVFAGLAGASRHVLHEILRGVGRAAVGNRGEAWGLLALVLLLPVTVWIFGAIGAVGAVVIANIVFIVYWYASWKGRGA